MAQSEAKPSKKPVPPYIPYRTFLNLMASWKVHLPSRIDKSILGTYAGGTQSAIISALRYLHLIQSDGTPNEILETLARSEGTERQKHLKQLLRSAYPFMFASGFEVTKATPAQINERFAETGATGDTLSKCLTFFAAMTKDAGVALTPHLKTRQRRTQTRKQKDKRTTQVDRSGGGGGKGGETTIEQTPLQILIDLLDPNTMDEKEEQAVWTLIRFIKKQEGES